MKKECKSEKKRSPLIVIILLPPHRTLTRPQCLCQSTCQTGVRWRRSSTVRLLVHANGAVSRCWWRCWCRLPPCHIGSLSWRCWRCGLGLGCCRRGGSVRRWARDRSGCGWWRWRGCRLGCRCGLLFQVGFRCPALDGGRHVHTKPPSYV